MGVDPRPVSKSLSFRWANASKKHGKPRESASVAENAIIIRLFALAIFSVATQKDPAFQASSPKTSSPPFGAAFFLRWLSGSLLFASPVDAIGTEDAMGGLWCIERKSTRLNSSHQCASRMRSSACKKQPTSDTHVH